MWHFVIPNPLKCHVLFEYATYLKQLENLFLLIGDLLRSFKSLEECKEVSRRVWKRGIGKDKLAFKR